MKKKIFFVLTCVFLLAGCNNVKLTNGENAVVTFTEGGISSDELYNSLKEHNSLKKIQLMTVRSFFRGLSSFGVLSTLITLLTYLTIKTESGLGNITGLITFIGVITLYLVNNKIPRKERKKLFIPMAIVQAVITLILTISIIKIDNDLMLLGVSVSLIIVFLYNLLNGIVNPIFEVANETIYYENIDSKVMDKELDSSYTYWFEVAINIPRIIGYIVLYIVSLFGFNVINICILIFVLSLMYIAFAITLKELSQD